MTDLELEELYTSEQNVFDRRIRSLCLIDICYIDDVDGNGYATVSLLTENLAPISYNNVEIISPTIGAGQPLGGNFTGCYGLLISPRHAVPSLTSQESAPDRFVHDSIGKKVLPIAATRSQFISSGGPDNLRIGNSSWSLTLNNTIAQIISSIGSICFSAENTSMDQGDFHVDVDSEGNLSHNTSDSNISLTKAGALQALVFLKEQGWTWDFSTSDSSLLLKTLDKLASYQLTNTGAFTATLNEVSEEDPKVKLQFKVEDTGAITIVHNDTENDKVKVQLSVSDTGDITIVHNDTENDKVKVQLSVSDTGDITITRGEDVSIEITDTTITVVPKDGTSVTIEDKSVVVETASDHSIEMDDSSTTIKCGSSQSIEMDGSNVTLKNGSMKIEMGSSSVKINDHLEVL